MKTNLVKITFISLLITAVYLITATPALAQQQQQQQHKKGQQNHKPGQNREKIESQRIAFITQKLNLTPDEAKVFWPVYNEYDAKRHDIKKSNRNSDDGQKPDFDNLTEKEASQLLDDQLVEAQKLMDLRKEYVTKFKTVLPAVKVLKLQDAEREFQKVLMDKIREGKPKPPMNKK